MRHTKDYITIFKRFIFFLTAFALLFLCACDTVSGEEETEEPAETIPMYTLPPVEEELVPIVGGELTFPIPENPATLNPLKIKNTELYNLFSLIYEKPVWTATDGTVQPGLAETWGVDDTGTVWTFHLREHVSWQSDYGDFTADDIIYTIDQIASYTTSESTYAQYKNIIASYTKVDDYTVAITLTEPGNAAKYFMTFPVLCKTYCESHDIDSATPVGTGPYCVTSYDEYEQMVLEANDLWWKQAPYIQTLTGLCYPDHDTELAVFEQGFLDFITTSVLTVDTYQKYTETESIDYLTQYYDCLVPNVTKGIFSDVNIRKAVAYALDKREIISTALLGHAVAADYPVSPDSYLSGDSANIYEYNLQKALELLEESGWKDRDDDGILEQVVDSQVYDMEIKLLIPLDRDDTYRLDVAENIETQLAECGIQVEIVEQDSDEYAQSLETGSFEITLCSFYLNQNPDISFIVGTNGTANYGGFSDTDLDTLLQNCNSALTEADMQTAYLAMTEQFLSQMPQISLYYRTNALIYSASITIPSTLGEKNVFTTIPEWYMYTEEAGE